MTTFRTLMAVIFFGACAAAGAQTPGLGETRPSPGEEKAPPAPTAGQKPPAEPQHELKRCEEFQGTQREDCLREMHAAEGRAAAGSTRRPEPATAPPPTNPSGR